MANNTTAGNQPSPNISTFRSAVANIIGELRSTESRDSFVSLSLEELVDDQISMLEEGKSKDPLVPTRKDRLKQIYTEFSDSIEAIKATPPEAFTPPTNGDDA